MSLPEPENENDRRNIAIGFVLRRIPETGFVTVQQLEAGVLRDFDPCAKDRRLYLSRFKDWYHYQSFYSFLSKLNTKGYVYLENKNKKISNRKHVSQLTMVFRGRNYNHYTNDPGKLVTEFLKAYPISVLDELAQL